MKQEHKNLMTTILGLVVILVGMLAVAFGRTEGINLLYFGALGVVLIYFKNPKLIQDTIKIFKGND